jgi:50S ribosomal protein L16 3-hydroxylase
MVRKRGVVLSRKTRMLYRGKHVFINGESFTVTPGDRKLLVSLADMRQLDGEVINQASADLLDALYVWYGDGWLTLG